VRSGAAAAVPATSRMSRSSPGLPLRAADQGALDNAFSDQPSHGAAQPLHRPAILGGAVQDAHYIVPRLVEAHLPDGRQLAVQPGQDAVQMRRIAGPRRRAPAGRTCLAGGGVDRVAQASEMRAGGLALLDDGQQVAD
jgi:hypothetical protein